MVQGIGKAFWHFLLVMLYMTLRKNHVKKHKPSLSVLTSDMGTLIWPAGHSASGCPCDRQRAPWVRWTRLQVAGGDA